MVKDYKQLYETAYRIGEAHAHEIARQANIIRHLRRVIWRALTQLRTGQVGLAHDTLERQIREDQRL